jgi:tetratricopeptide (TPR) repeat protein
MVFLVTNVFSDEAFMQLFTGGKYADALKYAEEKLPIADRDAATWVMLGIANEDQSFVEKALACYMVAMRNDDKNYEAPLGAARVYNKLNQSESAMAMAKKAIALKETGEASWEFAKAAIALNKAAEAKSALEKVVETDKANLVAAKELGIIYYNAKDYKKSIPSMRTMYDSKADGDLALKIGTAYKNINVLDSAAYYYSESLKDAKSAKPETAIELARIYFQTEKFADAAKRFGEISQDKLTADDLFKAAVSIEKSNPDDKDNAAKFYEAAMAKYGTSNSKDALKAKEMVGRSKLQKKAFKDALEIFTGVQKADPNGKSVPDIFILLADAHDGLGDRIKAIQMLEKVTASNKENIDAFARLADLYVKEKQTEKAQAIYEKLITVQPNNPKVYLALGENAFKSKKFEDALHHFQKSFTLEQTPRAAEGMMQAAWELKRYDLAQDAAETALHKDPKLREPQVTLAKIHIINSNWAAAIEVIEGLVKLEPNNKVFWEKLAACYEKSNNPDKLAEADKAMINLDKKDVTSRVRYAKYASSKGDDKTALATYKELAVLTPTNSDVFKNLYEISGKLGNQEDAITYLKKYTAIKPQDAAASKTLGDILFDKKDSTAALAAYQAALTADPGIKGLYKKYAILMMSRKGQEKELLTVLSNAVKAGEADEEIYSTLGEIHKNSKAYPQAIEMYSKALQLKPQNFEALASLAYCQEKAGKVSDAIISYEQAVAMSTTAVKEMKALGDLYWQQSKKDQAVGVYKKYVEKAPADVKTIRTIGDYEYDKKNYPEAVKYFGMVTGADTKTADFMLRYGDAVYQTADLKKATEIFKAIAFTNPKNPEPYKTLYEISKKDNNSVAAAEYLKQYSALKPTDAVALKLLGDNYYDLKNNQGALTAYRSVLKNDPAAKGFYKRYVELVNQSGTPDEKVQALSGAIAAGEVEPQMYAQLGNLYKASGNCQKAIPNLEKASQIDPKATDLLLSLAECQAKTGALDQAILNYEQALAMLPNAVKEYKSLGDLYTQQKKTEPAIRSYKKYLDLSADNGIAKIVAENSLAAKNYTDAIKYFGMITGEDAKSVPMLTAYGKACLEGQNNEKAIEIYRKLATLTPQNPDVFKALFDLVMRAGSKDEALQYLKSYTLLRSGDAGAQKALGDMLYERKDNAGALNAYRAALKADPAIKGIYARYAELLMASGGKDEEMIVALNGAISSGEADVKMYTRLGDIYVKRAETVEVTKKNPNVAAQKQENYDKACKMLEKASQLDPKNNVLISNLADCQAKAGNTNAAVLTYEQAIAMNPSASAEYKALGDLYASQNKNDLAIKNYKKYLEKNADNTLARKVGEYSFQQKDYVESVKFFGMVTGADAASANVLKPYGESTYQLKDDMHAYQIYRQLSTLLPNDATVFQRLYELAGRAGTKDEALTYLKKYTSLKVNDATAQKTLGDMLYERKDNAGALTAYRAALKADPSIKGFYANYSELVTASGGKEDEIVTVLNGAIAANEADVKMYVRLGEIYVKQNNFSKAMQMYEKASKLSPSDAVLLTKLGESQAKAGNASAAVLTYEQAVAMNPAANTEYKALGDLYMQQKKPDIAVKNYKRYLEKNADNDLARQVGEFAYNSKNYPEAVKYLGMINGADASSVGVLKLYGDACYQSKDDVKAYQIYKTLATKTPKDPTVYQKLYDIAGRAGTKAEELSYLKKYSEFNPNDAAAQKILGDRLYESKDITGALTAYRTALKADPAIKGIFARYAELLMNNGGTEAEITTVLNGAIAANEADVKMYVRLGDIYVKQSNFVKAGQMYEKASQLDPNNAALLTNLAECQAKAGNASAAIMTYEQAIAMNPAAGKEYKALGDLYVQQKRTESAVTNYKKYLEKNKDDQIAKLVGESAYNAKNYPEAVKYLGMISGTEGSNEKYLQMYGEACYQSKDDVRAFQVYKQLAAVTPNDASVYKKLYELAGRAGTKEEVSLYLKKYTSLNATDASALKTLGDMLYDNKDLIGSLGAYRTALKADPGIKGIYARYAELLMKNNGTEAEIVTALNGAIAAGEADVTMYKRLGEIYYKQNNFVKAAQMYEKASQLDAKDATLLTLLAESQAKAGNVSAAILTYEQAIAMNPVASKEYKSLGDMYMQQKREDVAIKNYKKYLEKNADNGLAKQIGAFSMKEKNYPEAVKYYGLVTGTDATSVDFLKSYAEASYAAKDDFKSYQIYKQLSQQTPNDAAVFKKLSDIATRAGTQEEVLVYLKKYVSLVPNDVAAQKLLGDMLYEKKDAPGAIAAYRAVIKTDPAAKGFYAKYAELIMTNGNDTDVITALSGAIAAGEADVRMYTRLGDLYVKRAETIAIDKKNPKATVQKQENYDKACKMFEKASQLDPKNNVLITKLAECQAKAGNANAAILTYEQAIAMNPAASVEFKALGDLYLKQSKTDQAVKAYKRYLEKNADNSIAKLIGDYSFKQSNYPEAVKYLALVNGTEATTKEHLKQYGEACYLAKDDFRAYQILKQLSTMTPNDPDVFEKLYDVASRAGTKEEVQTYLKKLLALRPNDAKGQRTLGDMLFDTKDNTGALNAYRAALKADPKITGIYKRYATLVMSSADDVEKVKALEGAIAANEADASMFATLASIYKKQNQLVKAINLYNQASKADPRNIQLLSDLAECQMKNGNIAEATMTYEQVVAVNPTASAEYKMLGDLYVKQSKMDLAVKSYKKYLEKNASDNAIAKVVGEDAYNAKNYPEALRYFGMITGNDAKLPAILQMYADAAYQAQDNPKALRVYQELSALTPKDPVVFKRLYEISLKAGASEQALVNLRKYAELKTDDADAQAKLGDLLYDRKDDQNALAAYRNALKVNPSIKGIYKKYVELAMRYGTPDDKVKVLSAAIAAGEGDSRMYTQLGDMYKVSGKYQNAIPIYEKASQLDPKNGELLSSLAFCQLKTGNLSQAAITYEQAIAMNPNANKEYKQLGDLYMQQNKASSAISAYKRYLEKGNADAAIALIVAKSAYVAKNYSEAFKFFAYAKSDDSPEYHLQYGLSAVEVKDYKVAISELEKIRSTKGTVASRDVAYKSLALAYEKSGDIKTAAEVLNAYVKLPGVKDPDAAYQRAVVYETINAAQAVTMYEENTVSYPKDFRNFQKLGIYYARQPNAIVKATKALEKCVQLVDTIGLVWLELGTLYGKQARDQEMLDAYRKFIEVDPTNAEACGKIGEILLSRKMTDDAMVFLEMANSLKENDPKIMTLLARGYIMTKRKSEAAKLLEKVVKLSKGEIDDDLRRVLADVYMESGEFEKAANEYKAMLDKKKTNAVLSKYAEALIGMGKLTEAAKAVEEIKASEPENLDAHMALGKIKVAQKKYDEAIETYKEILYINQNYAPALCERANVYMIQGKYEWAKTFYTRTLKADPRNAIAHLGLARISKNDKDFAAYTDHLEKAKKLDPNNKEIQDELKSVKR